MKGTEMTSNRRPSLYSRLGLAGACALVLMACMASPAPPAQAQAAEKVLPLEPRNPDLPSVATLQKLVNEAHAKFEGVKDGKNADYIPALAKVPSQLFGVAIVTVNGDVVSAGDADYRFAIESVSKPFTMAYVMNQQGVQAVIDKIGVEPTGLPFNSKIAVELLKARSVNPLVNAGAMATVSMVKAKDEAERWKIVHENLNAFAGAKLEVLEDVYESEYSTSWGNRGIANNLYNYERLYADPEETLRVYTRECSVGLTAKQLAVMGGTLANGGVNPVTHQRVVKEDIIDEILAIMLTAGFYDESGRWSVESGLPSKTGVGGGIVSVVPGEMAIVGFSPPLNDAGNSVRAQLAIKYIANELKASIFLPH
jgi:glutaminase